MSSSPRKTAPFQTEKIASDRKIKVCIACCSTATSIGAVECLSSALSSVATVRSVILTDSTESYSGVDVVFVPPGTKLSKIRRLVGLVDTDLVCICDPDLSVNPDACRKVFGRAAVVVRRGDDVVAFGLVVGRDNGTMLSQLICVDKWLSHRIIRPLLWKSGLGITLPGQFLIVSAGILRGLDARVDSYLDDLYLGWIARKNNAEVLREPVVVGEEEPRSTWGSLLSQRLRWMKGLAGLFAHLWTCPPAVLLLAIHFIAYHGIPMLFLSGIILLGLFSPASAGVIVLALVFVLSRSSGHSIWTAATFVAIFPVLHTLATLLWWIPASHSYLVKR